MNTIKIELNDRKQEIEAYFLLLNKLESGDYLIYESGNPIGSMTTTRTTQKASAILLLYNLVESIVTKCLERIHDYIISSNISYCDLNDDIRKLMLIYYGTVSDKKNNISEIAPYLHEAIHLITNQKQFSLSYKEMEKYYALYSGNLDSKKISEIFRKYGIIFEEKCSELQTIKDNRNRLAHGEVSFEECGRSLTIQQLNVQKDRCIDYLTKLIDELEDYLQNRKFRT